MRGSHILFGSHVSHQLVRRRRLLSCTHQRLLRRAHPPPLEKPGADPGNTTSRRTNFYQLSRRCAYRKKKKKVKLISPTAVAASLAPESSRQRKPQQIAARYLTPEDAVPATPIRTKAPHFPFRLRRLERVSDWCVCRPTSPKRQKWSKSGDKRCRGSQYVRPNS